MCLLCWEYITFILHVFVCEHRQFIGCKSYFEQFLLQSTNSLIIAIQTILCHIIPKTPPFSFGFESALLKKNGALVSQLFVFLVSSFANVERLTLLMFLAITSMIKGAPDITCNIFRCLSAVPRASYSKCLLEQPNFPTSLRSSKLGSMFGVVEST